MPIIAVVSIFNGSMDIDTDKLSQSIQENISAEQMENLQLINDTMTEVEKQLDKKKLSDCNTQAEVIYLFSLSDKSEEKDFVKNFASCFKKNQSDEDLIKAVNQKFGTEIKHDEFQKMMQSIKGAEISTTGFTDKTTKNNLDLVKWCENAYENGWGYVYGGYGQICTEKYLDQQASLFPGNNEAGGEMREVGEKWLGKRVCDCIGLIKSYAWYNANSGEIVAGSNGFTDCGANSIWSNVTESGPISNMPDTPGLAVWMNGHIKSNLAKVIFRQDLISIYQKQTEHRDKLRAEARDIVDDLVSKINSEIYVSASIQHKLLELADRLSKTKGKKVYGYLKPEVKAIVDSIVDELANDSRIIKLYNLWYEQQENTIRTYTDEVPDRIPLAKNKEFKSIKNAVIKEAMKITLTEDEVEKTENADEESVSNSFEHEENTYSESNFDSDRGVLYPHYSIKTNRNSVAVSSLYLLRYLCNMIQSRLRFEEKQKVQRTDKKLQQKINDKKQAQGLKM